METKYLISIVVPIYNVEKYLSRCLDSVLNQTYKNLEIILVDDGSTDNSGKICDEYALKDSRIKVIHKENRGLSDARNTGMRISTGKYILFLDSDDWISLNACEKLYVVAYKYDCDIVRGNALKVSCDKKIKCKQNPIFETPIAGLDFMKISFSKYGYMSMCAPFALYKTNFIKENNLYFYVGIYHEDELWTPQVYLKAKKICSINEYFYYHFERKDSITMNKWISKRKEDIIFVCKQLYPIFNELTFKYRKFLLDYLCSLYLHAINQAKDINADKSFPLKTAFSMKNRLKTFLFYVSPNIYFYVNNIYAKLLLKIKK